MLGNIKTALDNFCVIQRSFCFIGGFLLAVSRNALPGIYMSPEYLSPRRRLTLSPWRGRNVLPNISQSQQLPCLSAVQLLRAATRNLLIHLYYMLNSREYQPFCLKKSFYQYSPSNKAKKIFVV